MIWTRRFLAAIALMLLAASPAIAQQTQCVTNANGGGTGDAITIPLLPCGLATNLLILTLPGANNTTTPTLQMTGFAALPIVNASGGSLVVGALPGAGSVVLLSGTGAKWLFMGAAASLLSGAANNSALIAAPTTVSTKYITRFGFTTTGDAPALQYTSESGTCVANGKVADNGSCVNASDGGSWVAAFPPGGVDPREFGAKCDNSTDDTTAIQAELTYLTGHGGGVVSWPSAPCVTTATLTVKGATTIAGQGLGVAAAASQPSTSAIVYKGNTQIAQFTGAMAPCVAQCANNSADDVLTVTNITGSLSAAIGVTTQYVFSAQNPADFLNYTGPIVTSNGSGTGGTGTYNLNQSFTIGSAGTPVPMCIIGANAAASSCFNGYVSGTVLTVTSVTKGTVTANSTTAQLYGTNFPEPVAFGTTIVSQLSGTAGSNGTYEVTNPAPILNHFVGGQQTIISQSMVAGPLTPVVQMQDSSGLGLENIRIVPGPNAQNAVGVRLYQSPSSAATVMHPEVSRVWVGRFNSNDAYSDTPNGGYRFQQGIRLDNGAPSVARLDNVHVSGCIDAGIDYGGFPDSLLSNYGESYCAYAVRTAAPEIIEQIEAGGNSIADVQINGTRLVMNQFSSESSTRFALFGTASNANRLNCNSCLWEAGGNNIVNNSPDGHFIDVQGSGGEISLPNFALQFAAQFGVAEVLNANTNNISLYLPGAKNLTPLNIAVLSTNFTFQTENIFYQAIKDSSFPTPVMQLTPNAANEHSGDNGWQTWRNDFAGKENVFGGPLYVDSLAAPGGMTSTATCSGTCATTYTYEVTALTYDGETSVSSSATCTNAASLDSTHYCANTWNPVVGAYAYKVYGRVGGSLGLLATVTYDSEIETTNGNPYWTDTGTPAPGAAPPTKNTTGNGYVDGALTVGGVASTLANVAGGSAPALTGTCTTGSQVGGNTAGTFTATCTAQTVIITFASTAAHGWVCNAHDQTTPTDTLNQTSNSTTSCTLTGTTAASDVVAFNGTAF